MTYAEDIRTARINPPNASQKTPLKPFSQGRGGIVAPGPLSNDRLNKASHELDPELLTKKLLDYLREEKSKREKQEEEVFFSKQLDASSLNDKLSSARPREPIEEDDQSILDDHVSRAIPSPGTISPRHLKHNRYQHRSNGMSTTMPDSGESIAITRKLPNLPLLLLHYFVFSLVHPFTDSFVSLIVQCAMHCHTNKIICIVLIIIHFKFSQLLQLCDIRDQCRSMLQQF